MSSPSWNAPPDSEAACVLVVDDDQGLLRLIERVLRRAGHNVATASSGEQALTWLAEHQAALLLVDLQLPDLPGQDLLAQLASGGRAVPFVVITGQGDERMAVRLMKMGALDYLVKDQDFLDLVPVLVDRILKQIDRERRLAAAEESLRREHAFTSALFDTSGALIAVLDREGRIVRFNRTCEQTTGYAFTEVVGRPVWEIFLVPEEVTAVLQVFEDLRSGHFPNRHENYWRTRSGSRRLIAWTNTALCDGEGAVQYIVSAGIDLTEHKRLEKEVLEISEVEQRRIGQDLHDGLCQHLAGIEFMSQVLEQRLAPNAPSEAKHAGEIARLVRQAISQTRDLARGLSPFSLESEGLVSGLQQFAESTERIFRIRCGFRSRGEVAIPDHAVNGHLFRIAQEAVSNAIKHGRARRIEIELTQGADLTTLSVEDDGSGLPDPLPATEGMGLRIMRYRAGMIGGSITLRPSSLGGAAVICTARLPPEVGLKRPSHDRSKKRLKGKETEANPPRRRSSHHAPRTGATDRP